MKQFILYINMNKEKIMRLHEGGKLEIKSKIPIENSDDLSFAYTPGVAEVCKEIAQDKSLAKKYTIKNNTVAVITDGSAVLGLGNIGPEAAMPVMEGKAQLFKRFGGVDAFPIALATQNTEEIIKAVKLIAPGFGGINLEDISAPRCFEIEQRLIDELDIPVFHDDQHGTAIVVLAGIINALKLVDKKIEDVKITISGVGAAGVAIARTLLKYGARDIIMVDSRGIIYEDREELNNVKKELATLTNKQKISGGMFEAVRKADIFIGVSKAGILTYDMVKNMNEKPIIFAMANPTPEIMPDEARRAGAYLIATGRSDFPNQINNVLAFPGIFRGALQNNTRKITDEIKLRAAEALASLIQNPTPEYFIPKPFDEGIADAIAKVVV